MKCISLSKPFHSLFFAVFILVCLTSCNDEKTTGNKPQSQLGNYKMEVIDSVVFKSLSPANLMNYNGLTGELLIESEHMGEVIIIDGEGQTVSNFRPYVEGPNYTEDRNYGWAFLGRDELLAYGSVYFHKLTKSGDRVQRIPYPIDVRGWVLRDQYPMNIFTLQEGEDTELMAIVPGVSTKFKSSSQIYMDSIRMVHAINLKTRKHRALPGIPSTADYRTMGSYVDTGIPIMNKIKGSKFASVYNVGSKVHIHDMATSELLQTLDIPEKHRPEFKAVSFGSKQQAEIARRNSKIFSTGELIILSNTGRIPKEEMMTIRELPQWWESPEMEAAVRKYMTSQYMVFDEGGYLGELDHTSIGPFYRAIIGSENGYFWVQREYEDERDYLTFLKVKVARAE